MNTIDCYNLRKNLPGGGSVIKILITTDWYKPAVNGVVTSVLSLIAGLTAMGHEVRILTLSKNLHTFCSENVTYVGSIGAGKIYPNARFKIKPARAAVRELIEWDPDIVHSQCELCTFRMARRIAAKSGAQLVHTYHTVYEDYTHYFSPSERLGKFVVAFLSRRVLSKVDQVIVPTDKVRDLLVGYGVKKPIMTIPTGLKLDQFRMTGSSERERIRERYGIRKDDTALIYLGRLAEEKNVEEILEFFSRQSNEHLKMLVVGDGPDRKTIEDTARSLGLEGRVVFTGMVSPDEVSSYYSAGDIFVCASQSETQGLTYIEAMAAGLPLLCRNDLCLEDVVIEGVNGYTYDTEQEFQHFLKKLAGDREHRHTLGANASRYAFHVFSEKRFADAVTELYLSDIDGEPLHS